MRRSRFRRLRCCHHRRTRRGVGGIPPGLEKFQGKLCFSGQAQVAQNSWKWKIYIQYSEFRTPSAFQSKRKLLKTPDCKKYIQYSEKFQGNSVFQGKRMLLNNPEW